MGAHSLYGALSHGGPAVLLTGPIVTQHLLFLPSMAKVVINTHCTYPPRMAWLSCPGWLNRCIF